MFCHASQVYCRYGIFLVFISCYFYVSVLYFISDGRHQEVHFDKITFRISKLCYGLNMDFVDPVCCVYCTVSSVKYEGQFSSFAADV